MPSCADIDQEFRYRVDTAIGEAASCPEAIAFDQEADDLSALGER